MVSCPSGASVRPGTPDLLFGVDAAIALFGTETPFWVWPFLALASYAINGTSDICANPPVDIVFPTEQDFCDIGRNFGGIVAGVCSPADPGRAILRFQQWLKNQLFPQVCQCNFVAGASCGTYSATWPSFFAFNISTNFAFVPRPAGSTAISVTMSGTVPVTSPQLVGQFRYRTVSFPSGVLTYGVWTAVASFSTSGAQSGTATTPALTGALATCTGIEVGLFCSSSTTTTPVAMNVLVSATYSGVCTQTNQNPTPGSPANQPAGVQQPQPIVTASVTTIQNDVSMIKYAINTLVNQRVQVNQDNSVNLYPTIIIGTPGPPQTGSVTITVAGTRAVLVSITVVPSYLGSAGLDPTAYFEFGWATLGNSNGWDRSIKLVHVETLIMPVDTRWDRIGLTLNPGVTATVTEFS